ncbi:DSBA oxidoreductase [Thozetella sp. PMI_491]|nr:DSBA oxidoreductase [Thozetella sp. PMI_491]
MVNFDIKIVSDTICPWCYLGQMRLNRAIGIHKNTYPNDTFVITWHPFYLEPDAPKVGVPTRERMDEKFGTQRAELMRAQLRAYGAPDGINYTFNGKRGSTKDSHRLIYMVGTEIQNKVVAEIFKSYFEDGGDLTSMDMLADAAEKAGLDRQESSAYLESGSGGDAVDKEAKRALLRHIHAVPHIEIEGRYTIQGADDPEETAEGFEKLRKELVQK